jgi:very-short-patch-repair endonuclease
MLSPEIFRAAEINLGLLTRRQLIVTFGLSPHTVDALVRQGVLIPEHRGVYRLAGTPPSPRQAALAAVLRVPGPARVSGALVLGMLHADGFTEQDPFVLLRGEDVRLVNVKVPHRLDVAPDRDRAAFGPLPATTPLRALIEAADPRLGLPDGRLYAALDDLRFRGKIAVDDLHTRVEAWPPNSVGNRWRRLLGSPDAVSESHGERRLGDVLDTITPRAERQVWVTPKRRVDYLVRVLALILEYDGRKAHATKAGRRKDAHRDDDLETQGHRVVHVTAEDLAAPIALRARLVATYRQRARELGLHDLHIA